ncbi:MAG: M1 family aminopeptidase, partial [Cyclobacteriaceae bacterium]
MPDGLKAGAPGVLQRTMELPDGSIRYEWETRHPIAYYLISMAIADYEEYTIDITLPDQPEFPLVNYIYDNPEVMTDLKTEIDATVPMMELFADLFGPYPFADEKYGHAMAPMGGGMEHQTMSTMQTFTFGLNAHELAHQWFGDYVTCGSWSDIWINEGFARYGEYLAAEFLIGRSSADTWMRSLQDYVKGNPSGSIYIPEDEADDPGRIFDFRLTYNKGGAILHTLRYLINDDEAYFEALRSYAEKFSNDVATGADFRDSMEDDTGIELGDFFNEWYYGSGYPIYDITWEHRNDSLVVYAVQETSDPASISLFTTPMPLEAILNGTDTLLRLTPSANEQTFRVFLPGEVSSLSFDPDSYLIKTVNSIRNGSVTSAEPLENAGIRLFPNPADNYIHINLPAGHPRIMLTDLQGRIL